MREKTTCVTKLENNISIIYMHVIAEILYFPYKDQQLCEFK